MKKILIVDDELDIRDSLKMFLEIEGFYVEVAASGREGLLSVEKNNHDLIISDVMMPGISGIELLHKVKALPERNNTPFILMSAGAISVETDGARHCSAFIRKPFDIDKLLPLVTKLSASL